MTLIIIMKTVMHLIHDLDIIKVKFLTIMYGFGMSDLVWEPVMNYMITISSYTKKV